MARARNTASSGEVGRILRAHLDVDTVQKWLDARTFDKEALAKLFFKPVVELLVLGFPRGLLRRLILDIGRVSVSVIEMEVGC